MFPLGSALGEAYEPIPSASEKDTGDLRSSSLEESWLLVNLDWLTSWIYEDASGTFC